MTTAALPTADKPYSAGNEQLNGSGQENSLGRAQQRQRLLNRTILSIRESANIKEIFNNTTEGLRHLLKVERVAIYRFHDDWSGHFVAESFNKAQGSLIEKQKKNPAIRKNVSDCSVKLLQLETQSQSQPDTHIQKHSGATFARRGAVCVCNDIYSANFSQCYIDTLELYNAKAYLISTLHSDDKLWGLLAAYKCDRPYEWTAEDIEILEQVSVHLGFALQQARSTRQIERQTAQLKKAEERQKALASTIDKIRQSLDIQTIFDTTTQGLRDLLQSDRVSIYKFNPDWSGSFVAESFTLPQASLLDKQKAFPEMRKRAINCDSESASEDAQESDSDDHKFVVGGSFVGSEFPDTHLQETQGGAFLKKGTVRVCNDIYAAGFSDCYIDILEKYEARAYLIGALHIGDRLWGLLAAFQSNEPREWSDEESDLLEQVSNQLGVALQQAESVAQIQQQKKALERAAELQKTLTRTIDKIRQSFDIQEVFDTATQEIRRLLRADRVAIYRLNEDWSGQFVAEAFEGDWVSILGVQDNINVKENIRSCLSRLIDKQGPADSYLQKSGASLFSQSSEALCVCSDIYNSGFSDCYIETLETYEARAYIISPLYQGDKIWGLIAAYQNDEPRHWTDEEIGIITQIGNQLSIALKQSHVIATVRKQATELEKSAVRQAAISKTIDRIRNSLDIGEIFATTTQEVRQLLDVERVAIYRFNKNWTGAFVADSIVDGWQPSMPSSTVVENVFSKASESSGNYPRNEIFVPITQGEKLWGLLMAYQNSKPRYWEDDEVALLTQVGGQLAIALSQAELLEQTRSQAKQLNETLQDLRSAQARMVQGEKMAGLGQMMAGIAHEINNPVSFVFSNAQPAKEHVADMLELLTLYQEHYPDPAAAIQSKSEQLEIDFIAEDLPKLINSMQMGATRIKDIVQSMKVFSRMDEVDAKPVDIHQGIDSTLLILAHRMKGGDRYPAVKLEKEYADLPPVTCHPGQLNQVFMNLLSNAIEAFCDWDKEMRSPQIRIVTEQSQQNTAIIHIIDNGPGIPEDALPNIFNPFFTTKPVGKGTGLGLSISYQIITEIHNGTLECHSTPQGTIFRVELPI